ncbi:MAG: hypothetical protein ACPLY7_02220 [Microgenomates group bacterium]
MNQEYTIMNPGYFNHVFVFPAILRDQRFKEIPKILEIPERDKKSKENLELLRKLENRIRSKTFWKTPGFKAYGVF